MQNQVSAASVIIVTYNSVNYLSKCIDSIIKQNCNVEIIVVDNCSTDNTVMFLLENYSFVRVIQSKDNGGYGKGNNLGIKYANSDNIIIINPDTIMESGCISQLLESLETGEKIITTPKILTYDRSAINSCGHINHFTGLGFTRGFGENPNSFSTPEYVSGTVGTCFALKKKHMIELGGFDENFFMYREDGDLAWRAHLKKFKIKYVPTAVIKHDYSLNVYPNKLYHIERGRYMILKKYFSIIDFVLLSPSLLLVEILSIGYALKLGPKGILCKLKAINGFNVEVPKVSGDKKNLFNTLNVEIPLNQLTSSNIERILILYFNKIFMWNLIALKFVCHY
jgi:GT2 family glycosyltransferase